MRADDDVAAITSHLDAGSDLGELVRNVLLADGHASLGGLDDGPLNAPLQRAHVGPKDSLEVSGLDDLLHVAALGESNPAPQAGKGPKSLPGKRGTPVTWDAARLLRAALLAALGALRLRRGLRRRLLGHGRAPERCQAQRGPTAPARRRPWAGRRCRFEGSLGLRMGPRPVRASQPGEPLRGVVRRLRSVSTNSKLCVVSRSTSSNSPSFGPVTR